MSFLLSTVLAISSAFIAKADSSAQLVPCLYRFGPDRSGFVAEPLSGPLTLMWRFSTGPYRSNYSSPIIIGDGRLFFAVDKDLYALNGQTGDTLWEKPYTMIGSIASPLAFMPPNFVLAGTKDSQNSLIAVNSETGGLAWAFNAGGAVYSSPVIVGENQLLFGTTSPSNRIYGGTVKPNELSDTWYIELGGSVRGPIAVAGDLAFVTVSDESVLGIDIGARKIAWRQRLGGFTADSGPVLVRDMVIVAAAERLYAFSQKSGQLLWSIPLSSGSRITGSPAVKGTTLFFGSEDEHVYSYDVVKRQPAWRSGKVKLEGRILSSPVATEKSVFVGTARGIVSSIDASTSSIEWVYNLQTVDGKNYSVTAAPVVANGLMYLLGDDGTLYCFTGDNVDTGVPHVIDATIRVRARDRKLSKYTIEPWSESTPPDELFKIPGTPPLSFEYALEDYGSGIRQDTIHVFLNNEEIDKANIDYDPIKMTLTVDVGPKVTEVGSTIRPLPDGIHRVTLRVKNWAGNELVDVRAFLVDRKELPPEPSRRKERSSTRPEAGLGGRSGFDRPGRGSSRGDQGR